MTMTGAPSDKASNQSVDSGPLAERPARNIVLLSDGTGNSAAKLNKTNIWRLYQALDLSGEDQIAFYDDGVGTSGIRPLRLFSGGFGWGLSRNIRDLYRFLCRHYRPGDRIYLFGFSRGAFTVRTVAALIAKCGVLDGSKQVPESRGRRLQLNTREGLEAGVELAYQSYRRGYSAPLTDLWRWLRDGFRPAVPTPDVFRERYSFGDVRVRFVGVFDTVDAVGLPVDELSTMIDHIFYPHRFPDQDLSPRVERACHAIAIDDERHTFQPVLWNERGTEDSARITQVWFAGMHSNVGGGYPDDDLACVPLHWMLREAERSGLRFDPDSLRDIAHRAQALGRMYDSRRGFGVYYRYNPRHMSSLCADRDNGVFITEPKIHAAVFERIAENTTGYAPAGLPKRYAVVDDQGQTQHVELAPQPAELLDRARDHIFWRRVLYYLFVLVTLALVLMPYVWPAIPGGEVDVDNRLQSALSWTFGLLPLLLPGVVGTWAAWWTDAWTQSAGWFVPMAILYGFLLWHSRTIDNNKHRLSELVWWPIKRCPKPTPPTPGVGFFERLAGKLRHIGWLNQLRRLTVTQVVPVLTLLGVGCILAGAIYRTGWHMPAVDGGICARSLPSLPSAPARPNERVTIPFQTIKPCVDAGIELLADRRYQVDIEAQGWNDDGYPAGIEGLAGLARFRPGFVAAIPARRHLALPWFVLVGEIGRDSGKVFPVNRQHFVFVPPHSGRLYLYVNDAIDGIGELWNTYYLNNAGTATITLRPLD
jgi:uncharacterized protein (DUF2235 family)